MEMTGSKDKAKLVVLQQTACGKELPAEE